jgi:hypothetical protein
MAADDNVTCAVLLREPDRYFSLENMLQMAIAEYREASALKKVITQNPRAGAKLAYLAENLIRYIPVINQVFELFGKRETILAENNGVIAAEIEEMTSTEKTPLPAKIDCYLKVRKIYMEEEDLCRRLELKAQLREIYISIRAAQPSFADREVFREEEKEDGEGCRSSI